MDAISKLMFYHGYYEAGSSSEQIISLLLRNIRSVPELTIFELADRCYVSAATLSRLIKDVGFSNFSTFREEVAATLQSGECSLAPAEEYPPMEDTPEAVKAYVDRYLGALAEFQRYAARVDFAFIADKLHKADVVGFQGITSTWHTVLKREMYISGKTIYEFSRDEDMQNVVGEFKPGDVVFCGINRRIQLPSRGDLYGKIRANGGMVICMTAPDMVEDVAKITDMVIPTFAHDRTVGEGLITKLLLKVYLGQTQK